jgi:hypothetical protein
LLELKVIIFIPFRSYISSHLSLCSSLFYYRLLLLTIWWSDIWTSLHWIEEVLVLSREERPLNQSRSTAQFKESVS